MYHRYMAHSPHAMEDTVRVWGARVSRSLPPSSLLQSHWAQEHSRQPRAISGACGLQGSHTEVHKRSAPAGLKGPRRPLVGHSTADPKGPVTPARDLRSQGVDEATGRVGEGSREAPPGQLPPHPPAADALGPDFEVCLEDPGWGRDRLKNHDLLRREGNPRARRVETEPQGSRDPPPPPFCCQRSGEARRGATRVPTEGRGHAARLTCSCERSRAGSPRSAGPPAAPGQPSRPPTRRCPRCHLRRSQ